MKAKQLSRRTVLRGTGAAIALPFLEAMAPRTLLAAPAAKVPVRAAFFFIPNGVNMGHWKPGRAPGLPPTLMPLKDVADRIMIITGLAQRNASSLGDGAGDHARDSAAYLTGAHPTKTAGKDIKVGVSVDQLAAQKVGHLTRLASLELGTRGGAQSGNCDSGYSCAYSSNISWRTESSPMAKEINPRQVFIRLFGDPTARKSEAEMLKNAAYMKSALDLVLADAQSLRSKLGYSDQQKLDEYLDSIRTIEKQIQGNLRGSNKPPPDLQVPGGIPRGDHKTHLRLLMDLLVAAFQTDSTRIATFMVANSGSNRTFPDIGINEGHHTLSHHGNGKARMDKIARIDKWYVEQLAYMLGKMKAIKEERGTLLDNSMIVYGGAISDGNRHNHEDLPCLLAGRGGGTIRSGRHLKASGGTPMCDLFVSILQRLKVRTAKFGDSRKALPL